MKSNRIEAKAEYELAATEGENLCRSKNDESICKGLFLLRSLVDNGYIPAQQVIVRLLLEGTIPSHVMTSMHSQNIGVSEFNQFAGFTPGHRTGRFRKKS